MVLALRAARLFDGMELVADPVVVLDGPVIVDVGRLPAGAEVVDLGDVTLLPGLVDTHQHLCFDGHGSLEEQIVGVTDEALRQRARVHAKRALAAGITTIRDLGDRNFITLDLRGDRDLPTILVAGPPLTADGGHCWFLGGCCSDRDALVAAVRERHRRGCDVVKIMVSGGALTPTFPMWESQFGADDVAAVVDAAHDLGLPVAAHCHGSEGISHAVEAGVDTVEHCTFFTGSGRSEPDEALLDRIAAAGITVSATYGRDPSESLPPVIRANLDVVRRAHRELRERGGTIVVGTDGGITPAKPHDILPLALHDLQEIGVTGADAVATLTSKAAEACGVGSRKGWLAPGYDADVLAVEGDPVVTPEALRAVRGVWVAGRRLVASGAPGSSS